MRVGASEALYRITWGMRMALVRPCGRWKTAPTLWLRLWVMPRKELEKARPARDAAWCTASRGPLLSLWKDSGRLLKSRSMALRACVSVNSLAATDTKASVAWVMASTPALATRDLGSLSQKELSMMAMSGVNW